MGAVFSLEVAEKGLAVAVDLAPDLPETLLLDAARLRQILVNLMGEEYRKAVFPENAGEGEGEA